MILSAIAPTDVGAVLALNNGAEPHVNPLSPADLASLLAQAAVSRLVRDEAGVAGFIVALDRSATYGSENFQWFCERLERFLYVDRLVVDERCRGVGLGRRLHASVAEAARAAGHPCVVCEVNLVPPNPESLAFHERLGFHQIERLRHLRGDKVVALLRLDVS